MATPDASEWEEVSREDLRNGDTVRKTQVQEGAWWYGKVGSRRLTTRYERKVVKPSPEAMRAAEAVLAHEYEANGRVWHAEKQEQFARVIDKAFRGFAAHSGSPYSPKAGPCPHPLQAATRGGICPDCRSDLEEDEQ